MEDTWVSQGAVVIDMSSNPNLISFNLCCLVPLDQHGKVCVCKIAQQYTVRPNRAGILLDGLKVRVRVNTSSNNRNLDVVNLNVVSQGGCQALAEVCSL